MFFSRNFYFFSISQFASAKMPPAFRHCWLGVRKSIWPVKSEWWGDGMFICLERDANDVHGPVDATATPSSLASFKSRLV